VLDARRLQPGSARAHRHLALPLEFRPDPPLQDIDHLHMHIVIMPLRDHRRVAGRDQADNMRLQQAIGGLAHAEIAVLRVASQAIGPEVFSPEVIDVERLLRLCRHLRFHA
jgi:hypothetical protein